MSLRLSETVLQALVPDLVALRRELHRYPELSGGEVETAERLVAFMAPFAPAGQILALGGHGLALWWDGAASGPTLMLRADMDALPIPEVGSMLPHASLRAGAAHKCGHDGHMAMLAGMAPLLARRPPQRGRVVLFFQPAEETGAGAAAALADARWEQIAPDYVFALHNLPGYALGRLVLAPGSFASASTGVVMALHGATSHAATPALGRSPARALASLMLALEALPAALAPEGVSCQLTLIHARLGEVAFGTTPGQAVLMATLRAGDDAALARLLGAVRAQAEAHCAEAGLGLTFSTREAFPAVVTAPEAYAVLQRVVADGSFAWEALGRPMAWSEDFGHLTQRYRGALVGLGAGEGQAPLHDEGYDFPDDLLGIGLRFHDAVVGAVNG